MVVGGDSVGEAILHESIVSLDELHLSGSEDVEPFQPESNCSVGWSAGKLVNNATSMDHGHISECGHTLSDVGGQFTHKVSSSPKLAGCHGFEWVHGDDS